MRNETIARFRDAYAWLSNFWPVEVLYDGVRYPSVEHAYQAAKTMPAHRAVFTRGTAAEAKRAGRTVPLREDWPMVKVEVMRALLAQKFAFGSPLAAHLLATGDAELVEGNDWGDVFWGVCRGHGTNVMGQLLMQQRTALREAERGRI